LATYYRRFMFNQIALYMRNFESSTSWWCHVMIIVVGLSM
jgi:hypothetical protein